MFEEYPQPYIFVFFPRLSSQDKSLGVIQLEQQRACIQFVNGGGLVTKLCLTLCNPMDCSPPGSSVHRVFQARILEWVAMSSSRESSNPGIKPGSPALQADSLPTELQHSSKVCDFQIALQKSQPISNSTNNKWKCPLHPHQHLVLSELFTFVNLINDKCTSIYFLGNNQ